jgi:hypothetical protein
MARHSLAASTHMQLLLLHHQQLSYPYSNTNLSYCICFLSSILPVIFLHAAWCLAFQDRQVHWQASLQELRSSDSQSAAAADLQQQLEKLLEQLLSLPDPLPALSNAAALAARTAGKVDAAGITRSKLSH